MKQPAAMFRYVREFWYMSSFSTWPKRFMLKLFILSEFFYGWERGVSVLMVRRGVFRAVCRFARS